MRADPHCPFGRCAEGNSPVELGLLRGPQKGGVRRDLSVLAEVFPRQGKRALVVDSEPAGVCSLEAARIRACGEDRGAAAGDEPVPPALGLENYAYAPCISPVYGIRVLDGSPNSQAAAGGD